MAEGSRLRVRRVAVGLARRCLLPVVVAVMFASPAAAHLVHVDAHVHGHTIHATAYYHGDTPVRNAKVTAYDPAGETLAETTTDEDGKFSLEARYRCDHRLVVDTGDGHGTEYTVTAAELPGDLPPRGGAPVAAPTAADHHHHHNGVSTEIAALRKQIAEFRRETRLRDVLGGIGYIVGIAGIAFYFLGLKRQRSQASN